LLRLNGGGAAAAVPLIKDKIVVLGPDLGLGAEILVRVMSTTLNCLLDFTKCHCRNM